MRVFQYPNFKITIADDGAASLVSKPAVSPEEAEKDGMDREDYIGLNAAVDGLEATLLALASAGVNLDDPKIRDAVQTAMDAIENHYGV
jgi:hypothetical protein